jgi:hypothetical protein
MSNRYINLIDSDIDSDIDIYRDNEFIGNYDPLGLHNTDELLTLTPYGLSFIPYNLSYTTSEQHQHTLDIINQLDYNSYVASIYYYLINGSERYPLFY